MALYECVYIARQDISPAQVDALTESWKETISKHEGSVSFTENWGLRNLAYRVNKNRKGHYVLMRLECGGDAVTRLEWEMRMHEDVLRYLTVKVEEHEEGPSVMMRREARDEKRGPRRPDSRPSYGREQNEGSDVKQADKAKQAGESNE